MVKTAAVMKMARFPNRWLTPAIRSAQTTLPAELKDWFFPNWRSKKVTPTIPIVTAARVGQEMAPLLQSGLEDVYTAHGAAVILSRIRSQSEDGRGENEINLFDLSDRRRPGRSL